MHYSTAYNYKIKSNIKLPDLPQIPKCKTDLTISRFACYRSQETSKSLKILAIPQGVQISWPGIALYQVIQGKNLLIFPESLQLRALELQPIFGLAMAAFLQQRNHFVLHGSTVVINNKAVIIVGKKGFGKSTLTAYLAFNGFKFLSDDVTAIHINNDCNIFVLPGIPRIKLWPDALQAIGLNPNDLPAISSTLPKRVLSIPEHFLNAPIPLQAIIMLDYGPEVQIQNISEAERMLWLISGQYFSKHEHLLSKREQVNNFHTCSFLAKHTYVCRLIMPRGLDSLKSAVELIERL